MNLRSPHLFVDISFHGFGHIGQTAPVLNALLQRIPELRLTVRCAAPRALLDNLIAGDFEHLCEATDFGMRMASAVDVLSQESAQDYVSFHLDWDNRVAQESDWLRKMAPDLVLSNVSYLTLAAAKQAGLTALGMSSLNWADIFWHYCAEIPGAEQVLAQMLRAYNSAKHFIRLQPGMPMPDLHNLLEIGTVARKGVYRRAEIDALLGLGPMHKLVLVSMGGMQMQLPMDQWPRIPGVRWIVQQNWGAHHPDVFELEALGMHYTDVLCSCDALLTKPGYGNFAEAGVNGVPVLYLSRQDWPEEPCLVAWLAQHGRCLEVLRAQLESGDMEAVLQALWAQAPKPPVLPDGNAQAADIIEDYLLAAS